jgi:hypothetical protein
MHAAHVRCKPKSCPVVPALSAGPTQRRPYELLDLVDVVLRERVFATKTLRHCPRVFYLDVSSVSMPALRMIAHRANLPPIAEGARRR